MTPAAKALDNKPVVIALFLLLASLIRFHGATANDMWADELFSWRLTTLSPSALLHEVSGDIHPPLYFLLLKLWVSVTGDSLFSLRAFSILPSIATVGLFCATLWDRAGRSVAVVATTILLLTPASLYLSHQIRAYALCELVGLLIVMTTLRIVEKPRPTTIVTFLILCTTLNYLHFIGPFFLAGVFAALVVLRYSGRLPPRTFWILFTALALSGLSLVPWLWILLHRSTIVASQSHIYSGLAGVLEAIKVLIKLLGGMTAAGPALLIWASGLVFSLRSGPSRLSSPQKSFLWGAHLLVLVPFTLFALQGIVGGPFIRLHPAIVVLPGLALLLALCLWALPSRIRWGLGLLYGMALIQSAATIPFRDSQVPFSAVLAYATGQQVNPLIAYGDELALTQRYRGDTALTILDIRALPPTLCGNRIGLEIPAGNATYAAETHSATYGLIAPGGRVQSFTLPETLTLLSSQPFPTENTWKPWVTETYQLLLFQGPPCP